MDKMTDSYNTMILKENIPMKPVVSVVSDNSDNVMYTVFIHANEEEKMYFMVDLKGTGKIWCAYTQIKLM